MIPLRVWVKNFLCYREPVEYRFDGSELWVLCGPNGVGKSAVVDAMTYALFGKFRNCQRRDNRAEELIHRGERSFRVEFDFEYGGRRYRIQRTRSRSGSTQAVLEWADPTGDAGATLGPIPDLDSVRAVDEWVRTMLGLTFETFTAAALLRQGEADHLLGADRDDRLKVVHGIIDFERYRDLHARVVDEVRLRKREVQERRSALAQMPAVTPEELATAAVEHEEAEARLRQARHAEAAMRALLGPAHAWETLDVERQRLERLLADAANRSARAADLDRQMGRLRELRGLVPALEHEAASRRQLADARAECDRIAAERAAAEVSGHELKAALDDARRRADRHRDQVHRLAGQISQAEAERSHLEARIGQAERAANLRHRRCALRTQLAAFPADLDARLATAAAELTTAREAQTALPLGDAGRHRAAYRRAKLAEQAAVAQAAARADDLETCRAAEHEAKSNQDAAEGRQHEAAAALAAAEARWSDVRKRRERFATEAGAATCSACGQPVTAEHRERESRRLDDAAMSAGAEVDRLRAAREAADADRRASQRRYQEAQKARQDAEQAHRDANLERKAAADQAATARAEFDRARAATPEPYRSRIPPIETDGFPTASDLEGLAALVRSIPGRDDTLKALRQQVAERDRIASDLATHETAVAALGAPEDLASVRDELTSLDAKLRALRAERDHHERDRQAAEDDERRSEPFYQHAQDRLQGLIQQAGGAASRLEAAERQHDAALASLPAAYRPPAAPPDVAPLADERDALEHAGVEGEWTALADDRALQAERQQRLRACTGLIAELPEAARRSVAMIEAGVNAAVQAAATAEQAHDQAAGRLRDLRQQVNARAVAERTLDDRARALALHERFAELLGERGLQRDLIRDAEREILALADGILRRLSDGELSLERPPEERDRAFDLFVRRAGCEGPIPAANLSGGQRFRVAVALALAVCRFAGRQARPLESIFIDEGFGALDHPGRLAMIRELREGQGLKRIILISHQDDFADAFPIGYRLRSEAGATVAEPFNQR